MKDFEDTKMPVTKTFPEDIKHIFGDIFIETEPQDRDNHRVKLV